MKTTIMSLTIACLATIIFAQDPLTPPGAPGATMKTLDQVEPRIPISSVPYTISQSGSYYLTTNLTSSNHGIVIETNGVTLDLMGFTLSGNRSDSYHGVFLKGATDSPIENVVVRNGIVRNFGTGIRAEYSQGGRFEHLISNDNSKYGIYLNGSYGGQCNGNTISACTIRGNGYHGIYLYGFSGQCDGNIITMCNVRKNKDMGIYLNRANSNRVERNHITDQIGVVTYGIYSYLSSKNLIFSNTCVGQTNNFLLSASDVYGPIVNTTGELPTTGAGTHPLANFSF